jgi:DNA uptake protein ComE-like DNA-binding protein
MSGKEYLSFTKKERHGIIVLVAIALAVAFLPRFLFHRPPDVVKVSEERVEALRTKERTSFTYYRDTAGGDNRERKFVKSNRVREHRVSRVPRHKSRGRPVIDINTADTSAFIALPGIGSKLAARIVLFRQKLGGFYSVKQIGEVYGLKDSVFRKIRPMLRCDSSLVRKIDINAAGKEELKTHPYIRWQAANVLVAYRSMHGDFDSAESLARIHNLDPEVIEKMKPYLVFN